MGYHTNSRNSADSAGIATLAATEFASEDTLLAVALRSAGVKLGTDGEVLDISSSAVISAHLAAETLWELVADRAIWYRQGNAAVAAVKRGAGCAYLPANTPRLLVVTGASDNYVSIVAADDPSDAFESQVELLNSLKADYEAHRVATAVHPHADATNALTAADATEAASAYTLANDIKDQLNLHLAEASRLEEVYTLLNEIKVDYEAHRVLTAAGVHGAADATNALTAADATTLGTAITLANDIKAMYEAHRVLTAGSVHGAADATNVVSAVSAGTADIHLIDDTTHVIAAADASDLATLTTLLAELRTDYNAHLKSTVVHVAADDDNLLWWGTASLTMEEV